MIIKKYFEPTAVTRLANRKIDFIVMHYSAGVKSKAGIADNVIAGYSLTNSNVSSDYVIDDETVIQYNDDIKNKYTWHCGGKHYGTKGGRFYNICTNKNSIGIEICSVNTTGKITYPNDKAYSFTEDCVDLAVRLVKDLMKEYNIPADHVIRHYDVNGKLCPGIIGWNKESGSEEAWENFKKRISPDNKEMYYVQVGAFSSLENAKKYLAEVKKCYEAFIKKL